MRKQDLITALALNTRFTAIELNDLLAVLGAIAQHALKEDADIYLPGIGLIHLADGQPTVQVDRDLRAAIQNPDKPVQMKDVIGLSSSDLWTEGNWLYKHNVNVC